MKLMNIKKKFLVGTTAIATVTSSVMAQATFDPAVKAQEAVDTGGSIFSIVFGAIIAIVLGLMVIKYVRKQ